MEYGLARLTEADVVGDQCFHEQKIDQIAKAVVALAESGAARSRTPAVIMYEIQVRTRPSLTPLARAYAWAYFASTPADGGGPLGGFSVGITLAHRVAIGDAFFEIAEARPEVLVPADQPHRMSDGLSYVRP